MANDLVVKDEMTLFELVQLYNQLTYIVSESGGELTPEIEAAFSNLDLSTGKKIDAYRFVMNRLDSEASFWESEAEVRMRIAGTCTKIRNRIKDGILHSMTHMGVSKLQGETCTASIYATKGKLCVDKKLVPDEFKIEKVEKVPDTEKIREALERFEKVPGCKMEGGAAIRFTDRRKDSK